MWRLTVIIFMQLASLTLLHGQRNTYVGFEIARINDLYKIQDDNHNLETVPLINVHWGINIRREISNKIFLEVGIVKKVYWDGFRFKGMNTWGGTTAF